MRLFEIFIAYVEWGDGGKRRPVLTYLQSDCIIFAFSITSKRRAEHFEIIDWAAAGLHKPSFVDIGSPVEFSMNSINCKTPIGQLSLADKLRLIQFLAK